MKTIRTLLLCTSLLAGTVAAQESSLVLSNGLGFVDTPYKAGTLEVDDTEDLIINCDEVDCTTFVEYALAMALCPQQGDEMQESDFARNLQRIRYRDGKIDGYTSRLHYISDWINNAVRQGLLEDVTAAYSPFKQKLSLSYMSTHPELYKSLKNSPENVAQMAKYEKALSGKEVHYLPKDKLEPDGLPWIKNGDIIALTTNTPGLDVSHMGIAIYIKGQLHLLHASSKEGKVVVGKTALSQMLKDRKSLTGIRVLRMKNNLHNLPVVNTSFDIFSFSCQYERKLADFMTAPSAFRQQPEVRKAESGTFLPGKPDFCSRRAGV